MIWIWLLACTDDEPPDTPEIPGGRAASVGYAADDGTALWIAGGRTASGVTDDTLRLDLLTGELTLGPPAGEPLYRAAAAAGGPGGVVFGGTNGFDQETDHTWLWTPEAEVPWVAGATGAPARSWHASAWGEAQLWVHGGRRDDTDVLVHEDLWAYDPGADVWTETALPSGGPGDLYRHGMAWLDGDLWLFGGLDANGESTQALWRLDRGAGQWVQQELGLPAPGARASHRLLTVDDRLWLWGGDGDDDSVWTRGADDAAWTELPDSDGPLVREDPLIAPLPDGTGVVLFGGDLDGQGVVNDAWTWDAATQAWTELAPIR